MASARGFTLIELVAVMVVLSIGFLAMAQMFQKFNSTLSGAEAQAKAAQYAQECAELVLKTKRDLGYSSTSLTSSFCNTLTLDTGYTRTLTFTSPSTTGACPTGATCKDVTVSVSSSAGSSSVTFTLIQ